MSPEMMENAILELTQEVKEQRAEIEELKNKLSVLLEGVK